MSSESNEQFLPIDEQSKRLSIVDRFEAIAQAYPLRIALTSEGKHYTYQQLFTSAHRVAETLVSRIGPANDPVLILLPHSFDVIVGILGTLMANKAYVSLDPQLPSQRIETIVNAANSQCVITNKNHLHVIGHIGGGMQHVIDIDALPQAIKASPLSVASEAVAGVFFTSGSTGAPKGVMRRHSDIMHRTWYESKENGLCPDDNIALIYQTGFAASLGDVLNAILNGATLCLYDFQSRGVSQLSEWLHKEVITYFHLPLLLYRQWLDGLKAGDRFPQIKQIIPSGRQLRHDYERAWHHLEPDCEFISRYSTSETGMVTRNVIKRDVQINSEIVPVGKAIIGMHVAIVNDDRDPVPLGEIGEIAVRSHYLVDRYWRQTANAAQKFVPCDDGSGEIVYYSGDLGRIREDGLLELVGRTDYQIKVRGYRIAPGEVEAALNRLDSIKSSVVVADQSGNKILAYMVPANEPPPASALRKAVAAKLPHYMVPAQFVFLEALPLTANGKLDRTALPGPRAARPELSTPFVAPQTSTQQKLAVIWESVLDVDQIGIHDPFLELGGHSLLAGQVLTHVSDEFGVDLSPNALYSASTIDELSRLITGGAASVKIPMTVRENPVLSYAQERLWILQILDPQSAHYNMPKLIQFDGELDIDALQLAIHGVVERHGVLRTVIERLDGVPTAKFKDDWSVNVESIDARRFNEHRRGQELHKRVTTPFDLSRDLMMRATLFRLQNKRYMLLIVTHHIATDHHSSRILLDEIRQIYNAQIGNPKQAVRNENVDRLLESILPTLNFKYSDFAAWQRDNADDFNDLETKWNLHLSGVTPLNLPVDRPYKESSSRHGNRIPFDLPEGLINRLEVFSRQNNITLFGSLLAAFAVLLHGVSRQDDITIGIPATQRNHIHLDGVVGCFLNMLVVRSSQSAENTGTVLFDRIRSELHWVLDHQRLPFQKIVSVCQRGRGSVRTPLYQVMLDYMVAAPDQGKWNDLRTTVHPWTDRQSLYELSLYIVNRDGKFECTWEYDADLFDEVTINGFGRGLTTIIEKLLDDPNVTMSHLYEAAEDAVRETRQQDEKDALDNHWRTSFQRLGSRLPFGRRLGR